MNHLLESLSLLTLCLFLGACTTTQTTTTTTTSTPNTSRTIVRKAPNVTYTLDTLVLQPDPYSSLVELETRFGTMKIELFFDAQEHRGNFIKLANENYYDSLLFHRVIKGFMAQGGDPESRNAAPGARLGNGGPSYKIPAEIGQHYYHIKGALAAARTGDNMNPERQSSGSQFYIVHGSRVSPEQLDKNERTHNIVYTQRQRELYTRLGGSPQLDMKYTVFGRVYEGLNIIDSLALQPTDAYSRPNQDLHMKVRVIRE